MKITEVILAPKELKDTGSSATISSAIQGDQTQDVVPQDIVSENNLALEVDSIEEHPDHSAIAEGVSQILRRTKGKSTQARIQMLIGTQERSYRGQTKHLFHEDGSTEVCKDQEETSGQGRHSRQETGHDQEVRSRIFEVERCPDKEKVSER